MQNAAGRRFTDAQTHRIQDKDTCKAQDAGLYRQGDLQACEAGKHHRQRHGMPPLEKPADIRRQRRPERDGKEVGRRQRANDGICIAHVHHWLGKGWPDHLDRVGRH